MCLRNRFNPMKPVGSADVGNFRITFALAPKCNRYCQRTFEQR